VCFLRFRCQGFVCRAKSGGLKVRQKFQTTPLVISCPSESGHGLPASIAMRGYRGEYEKITPPDIQYKLYESIISNIVTNETLK
jgi:hypothetical protein